MKILLDECLPIDFRRHFPNHDVHTAEWARFKSLRNGMLLAEAENAGYQVFLTVDRGISRQQNFMQRKISLIVVQARTNQLEDLFPLTEAILLALERIQPGQIVSVSCA